MGREGVRERMGERERERQRGREREREREEDREKSIQKQIVGLIFNKRHNLRLNKIDNPALQMTGSKSFCSILKYFKNSDCHGKNKKINK